MTQVTVEHMYYTGNRACSCYLSCNYVDHAMLQYPRFFLLPEFSGSTSSSSTFCAFIGMQSALMTFIGVLLFLYLYLYLYLYLLQFSVHILYIFLRICISSHAVVTSVRLSNVVTLFLFRCSGVCEEGETSAADILASLARALEGYVPMLAMLR